MRQLLERKIISKEAIIGVVGLGYVGLPLAVEKAKAGFKVIGFDMQYEKVNMVNQGINYIGDIVDEELKSLVDQGDLMATEDFDFINQVDCIAICVPTPLDTHHQPDLSYVKNSVEDIAKRLHKGMLIILESTTYPGTTEEVVKPILESSGFKCGEDFYLAFSPERVDPGNKLYNTKNTPKVVGGVGEDSTRLASELYKQVLDGEVHEVSSPAVAEMEKILENTFRNVNIALVNEMAILCNKMNIDIWEVIDAAKTKPYGFMPFYPGPGVGGHCIPIDPFYLTWKAKEHQYNIKLVEASNDINNYMGSFVLERVMKILNNQGKALNGSKVYILGLTYKQDIDDVRQSPATKIFRLMKENGAEVYYNDPYISSYNDAKEVYESTELTKESLEDKDIVIVTTMHSTYDYEFIQKHSKVVFDTKNAMKNVFNRDNIEKL